MKNLITTLSIVLLLTSNATFAINDTQKENFYNEKELKSQMAKVKIRRLIISNALLLNEAQKEKTYKIYEQSNEKEAILYLKLKRENKLLENLCHDKNVSFAEKNQQKKIINNIKKDIKYIEKNNDKQVKKILNRQQKSKYRLLKHEINVL